MGYWIAYPCRYGKRYVKVLENVHERIDIDTVEDLAKANELVMRGDICLDFN